MNAPARRILLVEDNPADAELIVELLETEPELAVRVDHVATLAGALSHLCAAATDAVLLDLRLPDGTGVECVAAIRALGTDVPIVVLTGVDDGELAVACLNAGAQDYLSKRDTRSTHLRRAIGYAIARTSESRQRQRADGLQTRLAAIVESSTDAIFSFSGDHLITSWNAGAERLFGCPRARAIGRSVTEFLAPGDAAGDTREASGRAADGAVDAVDDGRAFETRSSGAGRGERALSVVETPLRDDTGRVVGTAVICRDITDAKRRDAELRATNAELSAREEQLRALAERLTAIREDERTRISREVHDELGQLLTGLKMDLRWLRRKAGAVETDALLTRLDDAEALVERTLESVQRIAVELRPTALDALGLADTLRDEARRFAARSGIATTVHVAHDAPPEPRAATTLFRIAQELLTNVARHAKATTIRVELDSDDDGWTMRVSDDGVGFRENGAARRGESLGIVGMRERARSVGGSLDFAGAPGAGTTATVRVPRTRTQEAPDEQPADRR